ncbi:hypothetical protein [Nocardia aurea]|uniref:DUF2336 domain-containing protein n=1 Tax=Nocardia aurea TaxID=2144174 RepID=A0ABV3G1W0_9NOCA
MKDSPTARSSTLAGLARVLDVPVDRIAYLAEVPADDIAGLRRQIGDLLFDSTAPGLGKIAAATRVIPPAIAAKVITRNKSALMTAHMAAVMDTPRAIATAKRLPPDYLAEVATHLDLSRSSALIGGLPDDLVVTVARSLADRQDWITLSAMIEIATDAHLARCLDALDAGEIVAAASLIAGSDASARVIALVSEPLATQLRDVVDTPPPTVES